MNRKKPFLVSVGVFQDLKELYSNVLFAVGSSKTMVGCLRSLLAAQKVNYREAGATLQII